MKAHWLFAVLIASGSVAACDTDPTSSDQIVAGTDDLGRFEIVKERAAADGRLELRVRAEKLEAADQIARKLADQRKSTSKRIAKIEFVSMQDPIEGPSRRVVTDP